MNEIKNEWERVRFIDLQRDRDRDIDIEKARERKRIRYFNVKKDVLKGYLIASTSTGIPFNEVNELCDNVKLTANVVKYQELGLG